MSAFPCKSCVYSGRTIYTDPCAQCANDYIRSGVPTQYEKSKAKTNFQMIKEMNEEEMANMFDTWIGDCACGNAPCKKICEKYRYTEDGKGCKDIWLEWLREKSE